MIGKKIDDTGSKLCADGSLYLSFVPDQELGGSIVDGSCAGFSCAGFSGRDVERLRKLLAIKPTDRFLLVATAKTCDVSLAVYPTEQAARDAARDYWTAERVLKKADEQFHEPPTADDLLELAIMRVTPDGEILGCDDSVRRFDGPADRFLLSASCTTMDIPLRAYDTEQAARQAAKIYWTPERIVEHAKKIGIHGDRPGVADVEGVTLDKIAPDGSITTVELMCCVFDHESEKPVRDRAAHRP